MGYFDADVRVYIDVLGLLYVFWASIVYHPLISSAGYAGLGYALA